MKINTLGDEVLRLRAAEVEVSEINDEMRELFKEMFITMEKANGVGLAAPQVGISKRIFVARSDDEVDRVFVNPVITSYSEATCDYEEGCLSIPGVYESITRPERVSVKAFDENGQEFTLKAKGLLARIIQHECDHLDGVLFIDRGDEAFAEKTKKRFEKARRAKNSKNIRGRIS